MIMYKAIAALLTYPDDALRAALPEIAEVIAADQSLPRADRAALAGLVAYLSAGDSYALQEEYVACFDRGRATSLHLFEHVHGESRDRGQALVDLGTQYAAAGLLMAEGELPDYLPAFLEYVASLARAEARGQMAEIAHILQDMFAALARRGSAYQAALQVLIGLAGGKAVLPPKQKNGEKAALAAQESFDALDAAWEEPPVFGPAKAGACGAGAGAIQPIQFMPKPAHLQRGVMQ